MTEMLFPKKNDSGGFIFYVGLLDMSGNGSLKASATLAAGDVKISKDGGAFANLGTLPAVTPAAGTAVKVTLSQTEINCDNATIAFIDQTSPKEWTDLLVNIRMGTRKLEDLAFPATTGRSMVVDASGLVDANAVKIGPTGSGTAQTARDIGASVLLSTGTGTGQLDFTSGVVKANLAQILGTALTETAGQIAAGFKKVFDVASPVFTAASVNQTGDSFARIGAPVGASISADIAAVKAKTDLIPGTQDGKTFAEVILLMASVLLAKASGLATTTAVFRALDDSQDRVTATVDTSGNRTAVTYDTTSP